MAGIENLFAAEPSLPNVQTYKLPDNSKEWAEVITTKLREQYPEATKLSLSVEFRKKDDTSGTAIGAIHCQDPQSGKVLVVPIVAHKFELSPLDVWMETPSQAVHPLTNDTFKEEFFAHSPAEGLDARPADSAGQYFNDPSLWTTNYPPLQGRYSYASAGYPLLDLISDTMKKKDIEAFKASLEKDAYVLPKFKNHGHLEIIEKIAKKSVPMTNDFVTSALKLIPVGVAHIKKESPDKYSILSMADQLFDLSASEHIDRKECMRRLSKITMDVNATMNDVDQEGEKMVVKKPAPTKGVWLYDDMTDKPESANTFGAYVVKTKSGITVEGIVFPHVVDFAGKKKSQKIFISPSHSSIQDSIAGVKKTDSAIFEKILKKPHAARVGQTGCFVFIDDGKAIATIPVTIKAIEEWGPMTAVTLDGVKIKISRGFSDNPSPVSLGNVKVKKQKGFLDVHGMIELRPKEFTIPRGMLWLPMEGFQEVSASAQNWLEKEASRFAEIDPLTIRWTGVVYQTKGNEIERPEWNEREIKVVLASKGASLEKIAQILKKAKATGKVTVHGLGKLRKKAEIIKEADEVYTKLESICQDLKQDLVKIAAEIEDASTVDTLLSLQFLNPENLAKFCSYKPVFQKVLDYLAELLLASRLGLKDAPEGAISTAISRLQETIKGLSKVEASLKSPGAKTAAARPMAEQEQAQPEMDASGDDPFANGMVDGEMGTHLYLDKARKAGGQSLLSYLNGKRTAELNKAQGQMAMGMPPKAGKK